LGGGLEFCGNHATCLGPMSIKATEPSNPALTAGKPIPLHYDVLVP